MQKTLFEKTKPVKPRYNVLTLDPFTNEFTPQKGVRCRNLTIHGVRRALKALRSMGYPCDYSRGDGDPSVFVERIEQ